MAGPKVQPKKATVKVLPKPPAKASPGAKAAAVQQIAANKQFAAASEVDRRKAITKPMGAKFSGSHPAPAPIGYQPPSKAGQPPKTMNPIEKMLTPGSGGIAAAMTGGANRKKGVLRPR